MLSDLQKFNLFPASGEDILRIGRSAWTFRFCFMKDKDNNNKFVHELQKTDGVSNINLYFD